MQKMKKLAKEGKGIVKGYFQWIKTNKRKHRTSSFRSDASGEVWLVRCVKQYGRFLPL
jgi:hypothetical protein